MGRQLYGDPDFTFDIFLCEICKIRFWRFKWKKIKIIIQKKRIITTENEVLIFFPASEVCGCLNKFINDFENYLQTY